MPTLRKKATIHQVTTLLATSKNVLFPGHNHLLTTGTDDPTLWLSPERQACSDTHVQVSNFKIYLSLLSFQPHLIFYAWNGDFTRSMKYNKNNTMDDSLWNGPQWLVYHPKFWFSKF